jgi:hypothetical protein
MQRTGAAWKAKVDHAERETRTVESVGPGRNWVECEIRLEDYSREGRCNYP